MWWITYSCQSKVFHLISHWTILWDSGVWYHSSNCSNLIIGMPYQCTRHAQYDGYFNTYRLHNNSKTCKLTSSSSSTVPLYVLSDCMLNKSILRNSCHLAFSDKSSKTTKGGSFSLIYNENPWLIKRCVWITHGITCNILRGWFMILHCPIFVHITLPLRRV